MLRKTRMALVMGLLALVLTACGPGSTTNDKGGAEAAGLEAAISTVADVAEVRARYTVKSGMGSTVHIRITAVAGTPSLETVMADSLTAFAGACEGIKSTAGVSFQVTESEQENTIDPTAVGLPQSPTVAEIIDFTATS